jgi:AraC-like DNA-binding protein
METRLHRPQDLRPFSPETTFASPGSGPVTTPRVRVSTTTDVAEAGRALGRYLAGVQVEHLGSGAFGCTVDVIPCGSVDIVQSHWSSPFRVSVPRVGAYVLHAGSSGTVEHAGARFALLPARRGAVLSPGRPSAHEGGPGDHEALVIAPGALEAHLARLTGQAPDGPIIFEPELDLEGGAGATLLQLARIFRQEAERSPRSTFLLPGLRDALFTSILTAAPHNLSHLLARPPARVAPGCVKRAEEFIAAHAAEPIVLADIVAAAGAPARSLRHAFTASRGIPPMELLRRHRFDLARRRLVEATPGTTVASVVTALGLGNPGRFSVEYKKRFGVSPATTLAQGRGAWALTG